MKMILNNSNKIFHEIPVAFLQKDTMDWVFEMILLRIYMHGKAWTSPPPNFL